MTRAYIIVPEGVGDLLAVSAAFLPFVWQGWRQPPSNFSHSEQLKAEDRMSHIVFIVV